MSAPPPICLIGMSGVGKSHWAKRLGREVGAIVHDCDAAISERLGAIVTPLPGEEPVTALGRWMGMPWSEGYADRERQYLQLEEKVTREGLEDVREGHVLDATGSVIYLPHDLHEALRARCRIVYLRTPEARREKMLRRYLEHPKPVVWAGTFRPVPGLPPIDALPHAYAELLALRDAKYDALAHVTLDAGTLESDPPTAAELLARALS